MKRGVRGIAGIASVAALLAGCQTVPSNPALPSGAAAYEAIPVSSPEGDQLADRIGPGDVLAITVLEEPELSFDRITVDQRGQFQMPLIGAVAAAGLDPDTLARTLTERLGARYLRNPRVAVNLVESAARTVVVEGEVEQPGIYPVTGRLTLLGALALARSPTELARRDEIFVFRNQGAERIGARFDLAQLRSGLVADPQILPGDTVVVGHSARRALVQDFLRAAPLINVFTIF